MDSSTFDASTLIEVDRAAIRQVVSKLLQRKGMFAAEAEIVADRMLEADLQRQFSDGVGSLADFLEAMDLGDIDPRARTITVQETVATAVLDGSTGMGHVAATRAMLLAIDKARAVGTGTVIIRNSRPCGDLGTIAGLAAAQGLIGLVTCSQTSENDVTSSNLAWAPPATGSLPAIQRELHAGSAPTASLIALLSGGLAGVSGPRKRRPMRTANTVEFHLLAINPDAFGVRDIRLTNPISEPQGTVEGTRDRVAIMPGVSRQLAEMAARIKLPVAW